MELDKECQYYDICIQEHIDKCDDCPEYKVKEYKNE